MTVLFTTTLKPRILGHRWMQFIFCVAARCPECISSRTFSSSSFPPAPLHDSSGIRIRAVAAAWKTAKTADGGSPNESAADRESLCL